MARLESITVLPADDKGPVSVTKIIDGAELLIPMAGLIDKDAELARLAKEVAKVDVEIGKRGLCGPRAGSGHRQRA